MVLLNFLSDDFFVFSRFAGFLHFVSPNGFFFFLISLDSFTAFHPTILSLFSFRWVSSRLSAQRFLLFLHFSGTVLSISPQPLNIFPFQSGTLRLPNSSPSDTSPYNQILTHPAPCCKPFHAPPQAFPYIGVTLAPLSVQAAFHTGYVPCPPQPRDFVVRSWARSHRKRFSETSFQNLFLYSLCLQINRVPHFAAPFKLCVVTVFPTGFSLPAWKPSPCFPEAPTYLTNLSESAHGRHGPR